MPYTHIPTPTHTHTHTYHASLQYDSACRFIREVIPDAAITGENTARSLTLTILDARTGTEITSCRQQALYRKNGWPAEGGIKDAIRAHAAKETSAAVEAKDE